MNIDDLKNNKVFCLHPWVTQIVTPVGDIKLCPVKELNAETKNLKTAWNIKTIKDLRKNMIQGIKTESLCEACYMLDEHNIPSKRLKSLHQVPDEKITELVAQTRNDGTLDIDPEYIELSLDIECQSMCVQCNRSSSVTWKNNTDKIVELADHRVIKADFRTRYNYDLNLYGWSNEGMDFWSTFWEVIPNVKHLYLTGGEPFDSEKMLLLIRTLSEKDYAKNLKLSINTTGNYIPEDLWGIFKNFKKVTLVFSIDAVGERAEWLRYPTKWINVENNVKKADELNIHYLFYTTVHTLNLSYIPEIYEWLWSLNLKNCDSFPITYTFNHRPSYLDVRFVEQDTKHYINQKIWDFYGKYNQTKPEGYFQNLMGCLDFMWQHRETRRNDLVKEFVITMDKIRPTKFVDLFSELYEKL